MPTLKLNYQHNSSELCEIGRKYGIHRASTLFYDGLFRSNKTTALTVGVSGSAAEQCMWQDYFTNSVVRAVDRDVLCDAVLEDAVTFEDQVKAVEAAPLKPGGVLILENIHSEAAYLERLPFSQFQDYYFVELQHVNSAPCKLMVLTKVGEPIFKNTNKLTVITPSCRPYNLGRVKESLHFDYIDEWIIVYDGSKVPKDTAFFKDHPKIKEHWVLGDGIEGNLQRNYALSQITNPDALLFYLDDDNQMHPDLYSLLKVVDPSNVYSFGQLNRLKGGIVKLGSIDTAMVLIPYKLCPVERWTLNVVCADFFYIEACFRNNNSVVVDNDLSFYNKLRPA